MILNNFVSGEYFVLSVVKGDFAWLLQLQWTIPEMLHKGTVVCSAFSSIFFRSISCQVSQLDWFLLTTRGLATIVLSSFSSLLDTSLFGRSDGYFFVFMYLKKNILWLFYLFGTVNNDVIPHPSLRESSISLSHFFPLIHRSC